MLLLLLLSLGCEPRASRSNADGGAPGDEALEPADAEHDAGKPADAGREAGDAEPSRPDADAAEAGVKSACPRPPDVFTWPVPRATQNVPASDAWKAELRSPFDTYLSGFDSPSQELRWIKFVVLLADPQRVYFQDSSRYQFHYDFAVAHIPAFAGMTRGAFDALTLPSSAQQAVLGAVLFPINEPTPEYGIELALEPDAHPELVKTLFQTVRERVSHPQYQRAFYIPAPSQTVCALEHRAYYAQHGVDVGSVDRWMDADGCYGAGWAIGKLVKLASDQVESAYLDGRLKPEDVLLLSDGAPASLPFVSGVLTLGSSSPNSHAALLAGSYGVPFVYLRRPEAVVQVEALVGKYVAISVPPASGPSCHVGIMDVNALSDADRAKLRALSRPATPSLQPMQRVGALWLPIGQVTPADSGKVGGKAANFGLLAATIPAHVPSPAIALTFDLWSAFFAQAALEDAQTTLGAEIARRLQAHPWPAEIAALEDTLAGIRKAIRAAPFPSAAAATLRTALAPFDATSNIRFRSSTNVEDSETFVGAGLYDSASGCLADDLDADEQGPSRCDATEPEERGVYRAVQKVFASFYARGAVLERLRRGVRESDVGMALLVHHSVPDELELANGVATYEQNASGESLRMVSQLGAVSVANPDGSERPELVSMSALGNAYLLEGSSLVPRGAAVLSMPDDYAALLRRAARRQLARLRLRSRSGPVGGLGGGRGRPGFPSMQRCGAAETRDSVLAGSSRARREQASRKCPRGSVK